MTESRFSFSCAKHTHGTMGTLKHLPTAVQPPTVAPTIIPMLLPLLGHGSRALLPNGTGPDGVDIV